MDGGTTDAVAPAGPPRRRWAWLAVAAAVVAALLAGWHAWTGPAWPILTPRGPASWIVYPKPADSWPHLVAGLEGTFTRAFELSQVPAAAPLRLRAFRDAVLRVNGQPVALAPAASWKAERQADIAGALRPGPNELRVEVANAAGPPALWLVLELPGEVVVTDQRWESRWAGAAAAPAALAEAPASGDRVDRLGLVPSPLAAVARHLPLLAAFALLSILLVEGARLARRRWPAWPATAEGSPWPPRLALAAISLLWAALFVNDAAALPLRAGFDAQGHLDYVRYVLERRAVPLADEGWQMFQPPLSYLLTALAFGLSGASLDGPAAPWIVRGLGLATGLAHLALVAAGLRLVFPAQPRRQVLGLVVAGFLPCMLALHLYVGNEPLAGALGGAALLVALRLLRGAPGLGRHALLGLLLGLALLAKFSTLLLLPPIAGALLVQAVRDRDGRVRRLAGLGVAGAALVAACGWHFGRVWLRFGSPFVGGWDASRGFGWWTDPGYRVPGDFLRFGRALAAPAYAGFNGFWDGLYATLWGDGLLAGRGEVHLMPHWWSLSLMSAGMILALLPCLAAAGGLVEAAAGWVRRPTAAGGLLAGLALLVLGAIALMTIQVPSVVSDKASYGLMALLALGAFAAAGLDRAMAWGRWSRLLVAAWLGAWALTAYASHWVDGSATGTRLVQANDLMERGRPEEGVRSYFDILRREPGQWPARLALAAIMLDNEAPRAEVARVLAGPEPAPELEWRHYLLSRLAERDGDLAGALAEARRAVALDPLQPDDRARLALLLGRTGAVPEAMAAWREVLRLDPQQRDAHAALAGLEATAGDPGQAARHRAWLQRLTQAAGAP